ncbi:MAG: CBS domain-containing protein [Candidatus Bathyarchaeota archaeon]|nr:CBS domain-containing protein [Candidatus Bathyarchaeota archaeon]
MFPAIDEIGKRRRKLGLKQSELAKMAGVSQSFIAKLESGKIDPSYTKVKTIFEILDHLEAKSKIHEEKIAPNKVISVQKHESIARVVKLMKEHGFSQIPVFDGKQPVGSISEKTILHQIIAGKELQQISNLPAEAIMDEPFPQISEEAPLALISSLLQTYPAVLVSKKGEITGIITKADLLRLL